MENGAVPDQGALALEGWDAPPRRQAGPASAPVLAIDGFEGPLDWLVDLARTRRIDLTRLSIVALADAFEAALTAALATPDLRAARLGRWGDWLVMAADLTLLRSRLLAPIDMAEANDAQDAAETVRRRLLHRAGIARTADWLERCDQFGRDVFGRGQPDPTGASVPAERAGDVTGLLRACLAAIRLPPDAGESFRVAGPPFWSVADAAARIRRMLPRTGEGGAPLVRFLPEVSIDVPERDLRCRVAVTGTFLASLELARDHSVGLMQANDWAPIAVAPVAR